MIAIRRLGLVNGGRHRGACRRLARGGARQERQRAGPEQGQEKYPAEQQPLPALATGASSASPLSWIDDASLLPPGSAALTISVARWSGADLSEVDAPIVDAAFGVTKRFQLSATVPHVVGSADGTGPVGGLGTSYFSAKSPSSMIQISQVSSWPCRPSSRFSAKAPFSRLAAGESRYQVGLPVSIEVARGAVRMFAATGSSRAAPGSGVAAPGSS